MSKQVNMTLDDQAIKDIGQLAKDLNVRTRTLAVQNAVDISKTIVDAMQEGNQIVIRAKDGSEQRIVIPGIVR